jgi:hypothetical protein
MRLGTFVAVVAIAMLAMLFTAWAIQVEDRIVGLEIRMNLQEASQHWLEDPPKGGK